MALPSRLRERLRQVIGIDEEASRLAAAWAIGVGIGLSPLFGLHTAIALVIAFVFRLNKLDVLVGTLIVNPWSLTLYFPVAVVIGKRITGVTVPRIVLPHLAQIFDPTVWEEQAAWLKPLMLAWGVGAAVVALVVGLVTYWGVRRVIELHRRRHPHLDRRP
jgi:uncharacterized protein (DUF2062 family)